MKHKRFLISVAATAIEFVIFLVWGLNMQGGDEMGFGLITTYLLFPLTTLILSAYIAHEEPLLLVPFVIIMFAAQNFMPFIVFGSFEFLLILGFTAIPSLIGAAIGIIIKHFKK